MNCLRCRQHLSGASAHSDVLSKVCPAHRTGPVYQEFRRTRNVMSIRPALRVQHVITTNSFGVGVRKQSECISGFAREIQRNSWFVHADSNGTYARLLELRKLFLYAS